MNREGFEHNFPARWAVGGGGGGGRSRDLWAVVVARSNVGGRGRYTCLEVEWVGDGSWQVKSGGRTFVNCYEASTGSNAAIERTRTNVVHLFKVRTVSASSSSSSTSSGAADAEVPSSSSASSSSGNVDRSVYIFDKALGNVFHPRTI